MRRDVLDARMLMKAQGELESITRIAKYMRQNMKRTQIYAPLIYQSKGMRSNK